MVWNKLRNRHALRRWAIITQRLQGRDIKLAHVGDQYNWVDFFTKWVDYEKVEASIAYLTNIKARHAHPAKGDPLLEAESATVH